MGNMTDLEIIKKNFNIITESEGYDYWYELEKEAIDAATRMAAEIERLKKELDGYKFETKIALDFLSNTPREEVIRIANHNLFRFIEKNEKLEKEIFELKAALAEKPDIVRCGECLWQEECLGMRLGAWGEHHEIDFCSNGTRKEAKDEVICGREEE